MFPSNQERFQNELVSLAEARRGLKAVTNEILEDQLIFKRKPIKTTVDFNNAVKLQRSAYKGVMIELENMNSTIQKENKDKLTQMLVETQ